MAKSATIFTSKNPKEAHKIQQYLEAAQNVRRGYDPTWRVCRWMKSGRHWWKLDPKDRNLRPIPVKRRNFHKVRNDLLTPACNAIKSRFLVGFPIPYANTTRGSNDQSIKDAVRYATAWFHKLYDDLDEATTNSQIVESLITTGNAYQAVGWDPNGSMLNMETRTRRPDIVQNVNATVSMCAECGNVAQGSMSQCPSCGSMSMIPQMRPEERRIPQGYETVSENVGGIVLPYIAPDDIFFPPIARNLDDAQWLFRRHFWTTEYVKNRFGVDVDPEDIRIDEYSPWEANRITGADPNMFGDDSTSGDDMVEDMTVCWEYWKKPSKGNKGQRMFLGGKDATKLLNQEDYPETDLPFMMVHYKYHEQEKRFLGMGMVQVTYPMQRLYNAVSSMSQYILDTFGHPKWWAPIGSNIQENDLSSFQHLITSPLGQEPKIISPPLPNQTLDGMLDKIEQRFLRAAELNEAAMGGQQGSIRANIAIQQLLEEVNRPLAMKRMEMVRQKARLYTEALRILQEKAPNEALMEFSDSKGDILAFKAADLKKPGLQARVDLEPVFPMSRTGQLSMIVEMWKYTNGAIPNAADPKLRTYVQNLAGIDTAKIGDDYDIDDRVAAQEFQKIYNGEQVPPHDPLIQNVEIHIRRHKEDLNSDKWRQLRDMQDPLYMAARQHLEQTNQMLQKLQAALRPPQGQQ